MSFLKHPARQRRLDCIISKAEKFRPFPCRLVFLSVQVPCRALTLLFGLPLSWGQQKKGLKCTMDYLLPSLFWPLKAKKLARRHPSHSTHEVTSPHSLFEAEWGSHLTGNRKNPQRFGKYDTSIEKFRCIIIWLSYDFLIYSDAAMIQLFCRHI